MLKLFQNLSEPQSHSFLLCLLFPLSFVLSAFMLTALWTVGFHVCALYEQARLVRIYFKERKEREEKKALHWLTGVFHTIFFLLLCILSIKLSLRILDLSWVIKLSHLKIYFFLGEYCRHFYNIHICMKSGVLESRLLEDCLFLFWLLALCPSLNELFHRDLSISFQATCGRAYVPMLHSIPVCGHEKFQSLNCSCWRAKSIKYYCFILRLVPSAV